VALLWLVGILTMLLVLALSLLITRLATHALVLTGMSRETARFQARSAFTGTGFTTTESEGIVGHPVRRRIVMLLMVVRSAGVISVIISLMLSFVGAGDGEPTRLIRLGLLAGGAAALTLLSRVPAVDRRLNRLVAWILDRWTDLAARDYVGLLQLSDNYEVMELHVDGRDWIAGRQLADCRLPDEGVTVLGIVRGDGTYLGVPRGETTVEAGNTLIIYGHTAVLQDLDVRRAGAGGEQAHARAVADQRRRDAEQEQRDARSRQVEGGDRAREAQTGAARDG
jgi:hypothetical protein